MRQIHPLQFAIVKHHSGNDFSQRSNRTDFIIGEDQLGLDLFNFYYFFRTVSSFFFIFAMAGRLMFILLALLICCLLSRVGWMLRSYLHCCQGSDVRFQALSIVLLVLLSSHHCLYSIVLFRYYLYLLSLLLNSFHLLSNPLLL